MDLDNLKNLIYVIQGIAGAGGMAKVVYLIIQHLHDDDMTMRNKKIKNTLEAIILIETVLTLTTIFKNYYM